MTIYGKLPVPCGYFNADLTEVMHYLYLPVQMDGGEIRLPPNVKHLQNLVQVCILAAERLEGRTYRYVYLSARSGWASPDNPLNRPGWHCDGFGTNDLNFIWWKGPGTRFAFQHFEEISPDHLLSLKQFDDQVVADRVVTYPEKNLYMLDSSVVHAAPVIAPPGCWRQFIKVSLSDERYNLENNSHNHLFDYDWPLHPRDLIRNDPARAQMDFVP